jgi:hypothetical protein
VSAEPAEHIVTKGQFAALCGVTPARVSQWLSEGKIGPDALDGEGRSARIRVAVAKAQLRARQDVSQRFGANAVRTQLADEAAGARLPFNPPGQVVSLDRMGELKARDLELRVQQRTEEALARRGQLIRTADAQAAIARVAAGVVNVYEGALSDLATSLAARFELTQRDVLHFLRQELRQIRRRAAETERRLAQAQAAVVPLETGPDDPEVAGE